MPVDSARRDTLLRLLPGLLGVLLFLALALGRGVLGDAAAPIQGVLAGLLAMTVVLQTAVRTRLIALWHLPDRWHWLGLGLILSAGTWLRFWGIDFGLPYLDHPDEWAVADRALAMVQSGDFRPPEYVYPSLYTYMQAGMVMLHFLAGVGAGAYQTLADIEPARFYVWGRALTAALGSATLLCTYLIGRRLYNPSTGLIAAACLAFYPAATGDAHYITTDTPAMFFTVLAFLPMAALIRSNTTALRHTAALALLSGLSGGLAAATKYNAAVLVVPLAVALLLYAWQTASNWRAAAGYWLYGGLWAGLGLLLGFTLGVPYWLADLPKMLNDIASIVVHYRFTGHAGAESSRPALYYWGAFLYEAWLLAWCFLGGLILAALRRSPADLLVLAYVIPAFLQLSSVEVVFFRNTMPLLPLLCVLAAAITTSIPLPPTGALPWLRRIPRPLATVLVVLVVLAEPLGQSFYDNWLRAQPTTRLVATAWVEEHAPDGTRIWLEDATILLPERLRVEGGRPITTHTPQWYREQGFRFLVVAADARDKQPELLQAFGEPAAKIERAGVRHGPNLWIYDTGYGDLSRDPRTPAGATLGSGAVMLEGYRHTGRVRPGETLRLALYWQAIRPLPLDYTVYVHLLDANGSKVAQRDLQPLNGSLPTSRWPVGQLIRDDQDLPIPPGTPPGSYRLVVGMYDAATLAAINDRGPIDLGVVQVGE